MKTCTRCLEVKNLDQFRDVNRRGKLEKHSWCHQCMKQNQADQYQKHKDKRNAAAQKWRKDNPERWREMSNAATLRWRERNPEHQNKNTRQTRLARFKKLGITEEQYLRMQADQADRCAICRTGTPWKRSRTWHVDHDHLTGEVRGLLCTKCNRGLGLFQDSPDLLRSAIRYLLGQPPSTPVNS